MLQIVLLVLPVGGFVTGPEIVPVVEEFKRLPADAKEPFVAALAEAGNDAALEAIYTAGIPNGEQAARAKALRLKGRERVAFCKSFAPGSWNWESVILTVAACSREEAIGYVHELSALPQPRVRAFCYILCRQGGWDDLLALAERDRHNPARIVFFNAFQPMTLGTYANLYIQARQRPPG